MASSKVFSRLSSRLQPFALKLGKRSLAPEVSSPLKSGSPSQTSASARRTTPCISRLPVELSSMGTMMPLHSAIASARLVSSLSSESQSWSLVPQEANCSLLAQSEFGGQKDSLSNGTTNARTEAGN